MAFFSFACNSVKLGIHIFCLILLCFPLLPRRYATVQSRQTPSRNSSQQEQQGMVASSSRGDGQADRHTLQVGCVCLLVSTLLGAVSAVSFKSAALPALPAHFFRCPHLTSHKHHTPLSLCITAQAVTQRTDPAFKQESLAVLGQVLLPSLRSVIASQALSDNSCVQQLSQSLESQLSQLEKMVG